jgi:DNA-directed RNA polymerase subunit RPC12/RpoP
MTTLALGRRLRSTVDLDLCTVCRVFWFDRYEDLQLSPAATLKLFGIISEKTDVVARPLAQPLRCPRCRARLVHTHDLQRNTRFQYWSCNAGHGRLMTFVDFLRAKDFVRPLSPQQLAELRENVQVINCSNCAAPIDLATDTVCGHCGSPISMLDLKHMTRTIEHLRAAANKGSASLDSALARASTDSEDATDTDIHALVLAMKARGRDRSSGLIEEGLRLVGDLLTRML